MPDLHGSSPMSRANHAGANAPAHNRISSSTRELSSRFPPSGRPVRLLSYPRSGPGSLPHERLIRDQPVDPLEDFIDCSHRIDFGDQPVIVFAE